MAYFSDRPCEIDKATALAYLKEGSALEIGELADKVRRKLHSNRAYYAVNAAITYSNICEVLCPICSFSKKEGQEGAYLLTPEEVFERAKKFSEMGAEEIHIIGGIYSKLPLSYYIDIIRAVKSADPKLNIVAFTASECAAMAKASGLPLGEVFERLKAAGVNALPGGGAEIFDKQVRDKIAPDKLSADEWIDAMRIAHSHGIRTNATMLYGHIETPESVVDHLFRLRELQSETGGFKAFVPLPFRRGSSGIPARSSATYDLKICALARVVLDNFSHVRTPVTHYGDRFVQVLLNFGADDIGGTHWREEVAVSAGAAPVDRDENFMRRTIIAAGFEPVMSNSNYIVRK